MLPMTSPQLMSTAEAEYRRQELTKEFARANRGRDARARRRAARAADRGCPSSREPSVPGGRAPRN